MAIKSMAPLFFGLAAVLAHAAAADVAGEAALANATAAMAVNGTANSSRDSAEAMPLLGAPLMVFDGTKVEGAWQMTVASMSAYLGSKSVNMVFQKALSVMTDVPAKYIEVRLSKPTRKLPDHQRRLRTGVVEVNYVVPVPVTDYPTQASMTAGALSEREVLHSKIQYYLGVYGFDDIDFQFNMDGVFEPKIILPTTTSTTSTSTTRSTTTRRTTTRRPRKHHRIESKSGAGRAAPAALLAAAAAAMALLA